MIKRAIKGRVVLKTIENSVLKYDVPKKYIYNKYYPLIKSSLKEVHFKCKLNLPESEALFRNKYAFDFKIRDNSPLEVESIMRTLLREIRINCIFDGFSNNVPTESQQYKMRTIVINRLAEIHMYLEQTHMGLKQSNYEMSNLISNSQKLLRNMLFPRKELRILECYLSIMELIDDIQTVSDSQKQENIIRICQIVSEWESLERQ